LAKDLDYKIRRKMAERDFIKSQIEASLGKKEHSIEDG
jgi:hypothetical protein